MFDGVIGFWSAMAIGLISYFYGVYVGIAYCRDKVIEPQDATEGQKE